MELYIEFKRYAGNPSRSLRRNIFQTIQNHVPDEVIRGFYPKHYLPDSKNLEMVIFTDDDIWFFTDNNLGTEIKIFKKYRVDKIKLNRAQNERFTSSRLEIDLESGEKIILDSTEDSNEDWADTFTSYIEHIFNLLK